MARIRVLVVDDAVVVRRLVTDALAVDPEIEIAGIAANGRIALQKIEQLKPDIVTLDVEMPEMDGLETITEIRKRWPLLPVIMFSTLTERAARVTLDALTRGASDYVTKPANVGSVLVAQQRVRDDLLPRIKGLCASVLAPARAVQADRASSRVTPAAASPLPAALPRPLPRSVSRAGDTHRTELVVIGSSTGGPNALAEILPLLPADFAVPVVIVQHMPPMFTRLLAERLHSLSQLSVAEAVDGATLAPGHVWVAAGDHHVVFRRDAKGVRLVLNQDPPENSCRPAVDVTFRSAASCFGAGVLAAVLTGMGRDGLEGAGAIRQAGGSVLVQDEASSVVWGMPGFVARAGLADAVLPLPGIGSEIVRRTTASRGVAGRVSGASSSAA